MLTKLSVLSILSATTEAYQWSQVGGGRLRTNFWPNNLIPYNVDRVTDEEGATPIVLAQPIVPPNTSLGSLPFPITTLSVSVLFANLLSAFE